MKKIKIILIALMSLGVFGGTLLASTPQTKPLTQAEKKAKALAELEKNRMITEGTPTLKEGKELWRSAIRESNKAKALELYKKSADKGYYLALFELAESYERGKYGLEKDENRAFEYYKKSGEAGAPSHKFIVGRELFEKYAHIKEHKAWGDAGVRLIKDAQKDGNESAQRYIDAVKLRPDNVWF